MTPRGTGEFTRREMLKRGMTLTGAMLWATPVVQSIGMSRAFAQTASPCEPGISFMAVNVSCGGSESSIFFRFELDSGEWKLEEEGGFGALAKQCPGFEKADGDPPANLAIEVTGNDQSATVTVTDGGGVCVIDQLAVKGGTCCDVVPGNGRTQITVTCPTQNCD